MFLAHRKLEWFQAPLRCVSTLLCVLRLRCVPTGCVSIAGSAGVTPSRFYGRCQGAHPHSSPSLSLVKSGVGRRSSRKTRGLNEYQNLRAVTVYTHAQHRARAENIASMRERGRLVQRIEIKGEQQTIGEVFSERYAFEVPPYQRPYAWTTEHAGELLEDLLGFLGDDESVEETSPYFLGSVVLVKRERPEAQIVDGQQRLVTLTILLAVLRALVPEQYRESITHRLYEEADPLNSIPARYRLRLKERDNGLFQHLIQSDGGIPRLRSQAHPSLSESQRNICQNALFYVREVEQMPAARRVRLAQFIIQRCMLIIVTTPDLGAAYRIFSVLNNRGLDLTVADLLKAEIIGRLQRTSRTSTPSAGRTAGKRRFQRFLWTCYSGVPQGASARHNP